MFHLRVYDNFHYTDESEAYDHGQYATYEEAVEAAKAIVNGFMEWSWKENMKPDELRTLFSMFGEDPAIIPNDPGENKRFSAYEYACEAAELTCKKLQKNPSSAENSSSIMHGSTKPSGPGDL